MYLEFPQRRYIQFIAIDTRIQIDCLHFALMYSQRALHVVYILRVHKRKMEMIGFVI